MTVINNNLKTILIENQYIPSVYLFSILDKITNIKFEACEAYQKGSFRNRCNILGANGIIPLSIPLDQGRSQRNLITEVRISNATNWQIHHWKAIESCYKRSPWFEHYAPELKSFYSQKYDFLFDWNLELFKWALKKINMNSLHVGQTNDFNKSYDPDIYEDLRNQIRPSNFKNFNMKPYPQVFSDRFGFVSNLSIIDLLMNIGKTAGNYLEKL